MLNFEIMYHTEFKLLSCKDIYRIGDMLDDEIKWWKFHLETIHDGLFAPINNPKEFFTPFDGESCKYLHQDIGTDQLRIRRWQWIDSNNKKHILLDMNSWPGDNESGLVILDNIHILNNGDQWLTEVIDLSDFKSRLDFFTKLRSDIEFEDDNAEDENTTKNMELFVESDNGKKSIIIQKEAEEKYLSDIKNIYDEQKRLKELYTHEFSLIKSFSDDEIIIDIENQLDYSFDDPEKLIFVKWSHNQNTYILIISKYRYDNKTFILDSNNENINEDNLDVIGHIKCQLLDNNYLSDDFDHDSTICQIFRSRIHSFVDFKNMRRF